MSELTTSSQAQAEMGEKVIIRFTQSYRIPGGPGYNPGETAAFDPGVAAQILKTKRGEVVEVKKAPPAPPKNKMVQEPSVKKKVKREVLDGN